MVLYKYTTFVEFIMADKEATVYIVDVGRSMGEKRNGRTESDLDWAMRYVWDRITSTVRSRKIMYYHELTPKGSYRKKDCLLGRNWAKDRW